ncbi:MAG: PilZ domain-containing protein, partial [Rhodoferax sp.]
MANELDSDTGSGGSAAGKAYREQLAREGAAPDAPPSDMAPLTGLGDLGPNPNGPEARAAERRKVVGRARLTFGGNHVANGKMVDISATGACVLMEDMQPSKKVAMLDCDIFHNGKRHTFGLQVV